MGPAGLGESLDCSAARESNFVCVCVCVGCVGRRKGEDFLEEMVRLGLCDGIGAP